MQNNRDSDAAALRHGLLELLLARGDPVAKLEYQKYVVDLLNSLSTADARFADAARRFGGTCDSRPPSGSSTGRSARFASGCRSRDGHGVPAAGPTQRYAMHDGWHTVGWANRRRRDLPDPRERSRLGAATTRRSTHRRSSASAPGRPRGSARASRRQPDEARAALHRRGPRRSVQAARAQKLGLHLVRVVVDWPTGATDAGARARRGAASAVREAAEVLLELRTAAAPTDDSTRGALAEYAAARRAAGYRGCAI